MLIQSYGLPWVSQLLVHLAYWDLPSFGDGVVVDGGGPCQASSGCGQCQDCGATRGPTVPTESDNEIWMETINAGEATPSRRRMLLQNSLQAGSWCWKACRCWPPPCPWGWTVCVDNGKWRRWPLTSAGATSYRPQVLSFWIWCKWQPQFSSSLPWWLPSRWQSTWHWSRPKTLRPS